jgi:regulator of cell morphogenesis and NO signaling
VLAAHGAGHPELSALRDTLTGLRQELESHIFKEERVLFPLIGQLEAARAPFPIHCGTVENPIRVMEHEHDTAGLALRRIRELTGNHTAPADACTSFRALYAGLADLESDLHRHIHKENNILFPRAAALEAALHRAEE